MLFTATTCCDAKVFDRVPEYIKAQAVAIYATLYCPSLFVNPVVEREWLVTLGYDVTRPPPVYDRQAITAVLNGYLRDSTMTCAGIYLAYGPTGSVVYGLVDQKSVIHGMLDLF